MDSFLTTCSSVHQDINITITRRVTVVPDFTARIETTADGNLAANWKRFKRNWDNYSIVARLDQFEEAFKTATFSLVVGEDGLEIHDGMEWTSVQRQTARCLKS